MSTVTVNNKKTQQKSTQYLCNNGKPIAFQDAKSCFKTCPMGLTHSHIKHCKVKGAVLRI